MTRQASLILSMLIFTFLKAWPQTQQLGQVKGSVLDQESKTVLFNAAVVLLYDNNTTIANSTSTKQSGVFLLDSLQPGKYTLRISYIGYQTIRESITIMKHGSIVNRDSILMQKTGITLQTLEVLGTAPSISIKKDTLEFNTHNFKTRKNAVMEELLKKLPGLQIEKDGTIKVNGETIKRILINGRQFFGTETQLATKNLPADIIEKIQVIEQQSNDGNFKGNNNIEKEKVINIKIKKNWMNQFFGTASTALGTNEHYAWNANLNKFKDKEQLSLISIAHNMNSTDFLTTGSQDMMAEGITSSWHNALNYSKNVGKKIKLGASYHLSSRRIQNQQNRTRENLLQDSSYFYYQDSNDEHNAVSNTLTTRLEYEPDTLQRVIIDLNLYRPHSEITQMRSYETVRNNGQLLNNGRVNNSSTTDHISLSYTATFEKKFLKKNRMLRSVISASYTNTIQNGFNKSQNTFILQDYSINRDSADQRYDTYTSKKMVQLSSNYTEPIFKDHFLDINYAFSAGYNLLEKSTYSYDKSTGIYKQLEEELSNSFKNISILHSAGIVIRAKKIKYEYGVGLNMTSSSMTNENITRLDKLIQQNLIFFPTGYLNFILKNNARFNMSYTGQPQLPQIAQLQPISVNNNPINIQQGNPDLRMSFAHNFNLNFTTINPATEHYLATNFFISLIKNKIIYANILDSLGRQTSYPINVNGTYSVTGQITNALPIKEFKISASTTTIFGTAKDIWYTNNISGNIRSYFITQELNIGFINKEAFDLNLMGSVNYNNIRYSASKNNNEGYFNYRVYLMYNINLPMNIVLSTNLEYILKSGRIAPYDPDLLLLNATVSKNLFRNKEGSIKLHVLDLLNQNTFISRYFGENYIEDTNNRMLQRTFLVSFSYYLKSKKNK